MIHDELAGVKESESEAADLPGVVRVDLVKFFEDLAPLFRGDPWTVVGNGQRKFPLA